MSDQSYILTLAPCHHALSLYCNICSVHLKALPSLKYRHSDGSWGNTTGPNHSSTCWLIAFA